jgi:hypothetical protein
MDVVSTHSALGNEFFFLEACGDSAKSWREEFEAPENRGLRSSLSQALGLLRTHRLQEGCDYLESVELRLRQSSSCRPSLLHFQCRYFFAAKAYLQYLSDNLEASRRSLDQAGEEIATAIELDRFLLPLAIHCTDFVIQKARIARRERKWIDVKRYIDCLEEMAFGERPFCILHTGEPIRLGDLERFFDSLPLDEKQRRNAHLFLRGDLPTEERTARLSERIYTIPDMVIPYP